MTDTYASEGKTVPTTAIAQLNEWRKEQRSRVLVEEIVCLKCRQMVPLAKTCGKCGASIVRRNAFPRIIAGIAGWIAISVGGIAGVPIVIAGLHSENQTFDMFILIVVVAILLSMLAFGRQLLWNGFKNSRPTDRNFYLHLSLKYARQMVLWKTRRVIGWDKIARILGMALSCEYDATYGGSMLHPESQWDFMSTRPGIEPATTSALRDLLFVELLTDLWHSDHLPDDQRREWWKELPDLASDSPAVLEAVKIIVIDSRKEQSNRSFGLTEDNIRELSTKCKPNAPLLADCLLTK